MRFSTSFPSIVSHLRRAYSPYTTFDDNATHKTPSTIIELNIYLKILKQWNLASMLLHRFFISSDPLRQDCGGDNSSSSSLFTKREMKELQTLENLRFNHGLYTATTLVSCKSRFLHGANREMKVEPLHQIEESWKNSKELIASQTRRRKRSRAFYITNNKNSLLREE